MHASKECDCENASSDTVLQPGKDSGKAARGGKIEQKPAVKTEPEKEKIPCDEPVKKPETVFNGKLITEAIAKELTAQKGGTLTIKKGVIVTPSAKDIFSREKMELVWETGR